MEAIINIPIIDQVTKTFKVPYEEKRRKHIFYQISCKVGTMPDVIWVIDKLPEKDKKVIFLEGNYNPKTFPVTALDSEKYLRGLCTDINSDGYAFISR